MRSKVKALLLQIPVIILLITSVIASFVIKIRGETNLSWATPIILLVIVAIYLYGRYLEYSSQ